MHRFAWGLIALAACGGRMTSSATGGDAAGTTTTAPPGTGSGPIPPVPPSPPPPSPPSPAPGCAAAAPTRIVSFSPGRGFSGPWDFPRVMALTATDLYYVEPAVWNGGTSPDGSTPATLVRMSRATGATSPVVQTHGALAFVTVAGDFLYWARDVGWPPSPDEYVEWLDRGTGKRGSSHLPTGWSFDYMTAGPDAAYVGVRTIPDASPTNGIYAFTRDGKHTQIVQLPAAGDMFVEGTDLWYLTERLQGTLVQHSLLGASDRTITDNLNARLAHDASDVFGHRGWEITNVTGVSRATGAVDAVIPGQSNQNYAPIALVGGDVVWMETGYPAGGGLPASPVGFFRAHRDGTCVSRVIDGTSVMDVVGDATSGYVMTSDAIFELR